MRILKALLRSETPVILLYYLMLPLVFYGLFVLWPVEIRVTGALIPFLLIAYLAAMVGLTWLGIRTHAAIRRAVRRQRLKRALAALSTSLEELLASSPYAIESVAGQGEAPRYEVVDTRLQVADPRERVAVCLDDELAAQTWIAERHLAEREQ